MTNNLFLSRIILNVKKSRIILAITDFQKGQLKREKKFTTYSKRYLILQSLT